MAIRRRVDEPLKVVSVSCDTALDRARTPITDYMETRKEDLPVAIEGEELTWFTLEPIRGESVSLVKTHLSPHREYVAFQLGCTQCTDRELLEWRPAGPRHMRLVKEQSMDRLPDRLWQELGRIVLQLGDLSEGEERRFGP